MEQGTHAHTSTNHLLYDTCNSFAVHAFPSSRQAFACSLLRIPNSWLHALAATCLLAWWTFGACMLRDITHRIESAVLQIYFKRQHGYDINTINIFISLHLLRGQFSDFACLFCYSCCNPDGEMCVRTKESLQHKPH